MPKQIQVEVVHYPTLKTVMAIDEVVKNADTAISRNQIISRLPTKVMRSTLNVALGYLERRALFWKLRRVLFGHLTLVESLQRLRKTGWKCSKYG